MGKLRRFTRFVILGLVAVVLAYEGSILVRIAWWTQHDPQSTRLMVRRTEELREINPKAVIRQQWVAYPRISGHLKRAIITAEDAKFVDHEGFDWAGIQHAMEKNQRRGKVVAGGSTITQQLAKNLFLSGERTFVRKGQEALITAMLEVVMSKRRILEIYLNFAEWGEGVFGAEAAARHYFGLSAQYLSAEQAARLAAMLPRPRYYEHHRDSAYLLQYAETILSRMPAAQIP